MAKAPAPKPWSLGDRENEPPKFAELKEGMEPIDLLRPNTDHHSWVLNYLLNRIKSSEDSMTPFYPRWQVAERKMQAFIHMSNHEQMLRDMNNKSQTPAPAIIIFPYMYATISTIVTYGMKVFCSRKPFFPLAAESKDAADCGKYMEAMVQYQLDACKSIMRIFQTLLDGEVYGLSAVRLTWVEKKGKRRIFRAPTESEALMYANNPADLPALLKDTEERIIFAGTDTMNIDPFMFFPDPNVPMCEVSEKGEFVFWREFIGKHVLVAAQMDGLVKYVDSVDPQGGPGHDGKWYNLSHRSVLSQGQSHAGDNLRGTSNLQRNSYMVDQGSVTIIPKELGLGDGEYPEKWLFTILNKKQIIQAEPLELDHGRHPVEVSEPYSLGYGFGQPGNADYVGPIQDILSWLIASRIYNVRATLNNQWLYDPSKVDEKSLKYPKPGKFIKMKPTAYGTDVRTALQQFPVSDVTATHMADVNAFMRIGDMVSSVNDPMRGQQQQGGRQTATASRQTFEAGGSRLGVHMQMISQQLWVRVAEQYVLNTQQNQEEEQWVKVIGAEPFQKWGQQLLTGDFTYTIHDGTLPLDRVASFDLWKEILLGIAQSPVLSRTHSLPRIFEHVASLGGAPNITTYRLMNDAEIDQLVKAGNALPLPAAAAEAPVR